MAEKLVQLLVRVEPEMRDRLRDQARAEDRSISAEVRRALRAYLEDRRSSPSWLRPRDAYKVTIKDYTSVPEEGLKQAVTAAIDGASNMRDGDLDRAVDAVVSMLRRGGSEA